MALTLAVDRIERDIPRDARLVIDTSAAIAYLHGGERASPAGLWVFDGCLATGRNPGVMCALTVAELLVGPYRSGAAAVATMEGFFRFFEAIDVVPLDTAVARTAAQLRATAGLTLPDAAVVATALEHDGAMVITNDARWSRALAAASVPVEVRLLDDYVTG